MITIYVFVLICYILHIYPEKLDWTNYMTWKVYVNYRKSSLKKKKEKKKRKEELAFE